MAQTVGVDWPTTVHDPAFAPRHFNLEEHQRMMRVAHGDKKLVKGLHQRAAVGLMREPKSPMLGGHGRHGGHAGIGR